MLLFFIYKKINYYTRFFLYYKIAFFVNAVYFKSSFKIFNVTTRRYRVSFLDTHLLSELWESSNNSTFNAAMVTSSEDLECTTITPVIVP